MQNRKDDSPSDPIHLVTGRVAVLALILAIAIPSTTARAQDDNVDSTFFSDDAPRRFYASAGFGFDFSRGDYGEPEKTNSLSIPLFLKLEWESITFRLSLPYSVINGSENVLGGTDGPSTGGGDFFGTSLRHGIGDVVTSITYTYYPKKKGVPVIDLATKIKIPTAATGLGTGNTDVTLQLELSETFGNLSGFGGIGYRFKGGSLYDDIVLASLGLGYRLTRSFSIGLAYDFREASVGGTTDSHEISPYMSIRKGKHLRFSPYAVAGLSESTPDWGIGANVSWNY